MSNTNETCPICGGKKTKGKTTFSADLGSGVVVVREVDATVCSQCGEEWIDDATARQLEQIVNDARARGLQVEVAALKWFSELPTHCRRGTPSSVSNQRR